MTVDQRTAPSEVTLIETVRPRVGLEASKSRVRRQVWLERGLAIGLPLAAIALWQLASDQAWIDSRLYPAPTTIVDEGWHLLVDGRLLGDIQASLYRILVGLAIGATCGLVVGTAMGVSRTLRAALEPTLNAIYVVPKIALLPVFLTILGLGEAPKLALVGVTVFFFVWVETMETMANVPEGFREAGRSFGVSQLGMLRHVLGPAALPQIFVGLRVAMSVAVMVNTAAEFIVGDDGIGYLIFNARALFAVDRMYVGIVVVALLGMLLTALIGAVGRWLTPWHQSSTRIR
ncbi:ABC transporter permease [Nocardioides sp. TF02-7]|uniref:ABC transporter permease n=1 Tax=Nocardioides sp. TF02-7 TaxID=2917724 RepID=UPI001F0575F5|nr:ABC transporter permease [Nocardioides sp. TF02-7]UMG93718.1 ABC transporter permease [Nocardioides sp. TF02-7]